MRGRLAGVLRLLAGSGISLSPSWGGGEVTVTNSQPGHVIQDEGISLTQRSKLNFVGAGVTVTDDGANDATRVTIPTGGHTIQDEGTSLPQRSKLNFTGAGVTASDDAANDATIVNIPGGGGGGGGGGGSGSGPDILRAQSTANLTLTNTAQDVPGASVTLNRVGLWLIIGVFDFEAANAIAVGELVAGGTTHSSQAIHNTGRSTVCQAWRHDVTTAPQTAKLTARKVGTGTATCWQDNTSITAVYIGSGSGYGPATLWKRIYRTELTAPSSSVTISGLNGDADNLYRLIIRAKRSGADMSARLRINGDAGTNYDYALNVHGSLVQSTGQTLLHLGSMDAAGPTATADVLIHAKSGTFRTVVGTIGDQLGGSSPREVPMTGVWRNSTSPISSLVVFTDTAGAAFDTGTIIELWTVVDTTIAPPWKTQNLRIENDSLAPNNKVVIKADEITIEDILISSVDVAADITVTGAGGLDAGTEAANTWYALWLIYNPSTGAVSALLSTSFTSPVMPSGYTKKRRVGAVRNDANSNFLTFLQLGDKVEWVESVTATHAIVSGGGATTFTTVSASAFMPPTSRRAIVNAFISASNGNARARMTGTSVPNGRSLANGVANAVLGFAEIDTDSSQQFDYKVSAGTVTIVSVGYYDPVL